MVLTSNLRLKKIKQFLFENDFTIYVNHINKALKARIKVKSKMELFSKGAEANLYKTDGAIVKERVEKEYRIPELDETLRRQRTRREARYLKLAKDAGLDVPKVKSFDDKAYMLEIERIDGVLLKDVFEDEPEEEAGRHALDIGRFLKKLHAISLVHNDLTTSNMILSDGKVFMIDFGLAQHTRRTEDRAMDLVVFKKSLRATHPKRFEFIWGRVLEGYGADAETKSRVEKIEGRVRYAGA